jgi:N-acetylglucosaminyldiphosphoundecaprenol N-acetyl-beta-D-mannosaminyltransferase
MSEQTTETQSYLKPGEHLETAVRFSKPPEIVTGEKRREVLPIPMVMLGVPFDPVTLGEATHRVESMVLSRQPHYVVTANVDFLVQALHDVELHRILLEAHLVLCDGTPLVWLSNWLGNPLPERVAGADLVPELIQLAARKNYRVFFLGGAPEASRQAVSNLRSRFPSLNIVGHYSPPHNGLLEMDHGEMVRRIREARPDILFVSFGCPKAEKWMAMHYRLLGVPVSLGVGATIDFLAGHVKRAPRVMQQSGTEWIFRLVQEPRRLWRRYAKDLRYFGWAALRQWWEMQVCFRAPRSTPRSSATLTEPTWVRLQVPEQLRAQDVRRDSWTWSNIGNRHCLLDMANVTFIDSTGVGLLVSLHKQLGSLGRKLVLIAPSTPVCQALGLMHLFDMLAIAPNAAAARQLVEAETRAASRHFLISPGAIVHPLRWPTEVTAANSEEVWMQTLARLLAEATGTKELVVDLTDVRFIDSTGAGLMVRLKKHGARQGTVVRFSNPHANVLNVLRLAQLEGFLLTDTL